MEIATKHLEKLALPPVELLDYWNFKSPQSKTYAWREPLTEALHLLYPPVP